MPLVGPHEDGRRAYVPRARVGLLQNEGEMPRTPGFDLYPLLAGTGHWDLQLFTERTFGGLSAPSPMDALVVGYNAVHLSPAVREAFDAEPPAVHLLVLHQLAPECLSFLRDELAIRARPMPGPRATCGARLPRGRSPEHEMLLNWPAPVPADTTLRCARALRYLDFEPGGAWRVVLEAQAHTDFGRRSLPVLVRTADFVPRRIVVCTLLLESTRDAALLQNLVTYAATGPPELAVIDPKDPPGDYKAKRIAERLRLQGARTIRLPVPDPDKLPFEHWPLAGIDRVVVPGTADVSRVDDDPEGEAWLRRGGSLVVAREGGLTIHTGVRDTHWVARRWATWFNGIRPEEWQRSVFGTRAVLRMLQRLGRADVQVAALGVAVDPKTFERQIGPRLAARVRHGSAEETVGATAAAWDVFELIGKTTLSSVTERKMRAWLTAQAGDPAVSAEDKLDIARCLRDRRIAAKAIEQAAGEAASATLAVRLREAILACGEDEHGNLLAVGDQLAEKVRDPRVVEELRASPLLSAEFIDVSYRFREAGGDHPLARIRRNAHDAAVSAMTALQGLTQDTGLERADPYTVSIEAQALLAYLVHEPISAFRIRPEARELPVKAVRDVLEETLVARRRERSALHDVSALGTAAHMLGAISLVAVGIVLGGVLRIFDLGIGTAEGLAMAGAVAAVAALLALVRWVVMPRIGRGERREIRLAQIVLDLLVLMTVAGLATAAIRAANNLVAAIAIVAVAAGGAAVMFQLMNRLDLAPRWMTTLLDVISDPRGLLTWAGARSRRTSPNP